MSGPKIHSNPPDFSRQPEKAPPTRKPPQDGEFKEIVEKKKKPEEKAVEPKEIEAGDESVDGLIEELGIGRRESKGKGEGSGKAQTTKGDTGISKGKISEESNIDEGNYIDEGFGEFETGDDGFIFPEKGRVGKEDLFSLLEKYVPEKSVKGKISEEEIDVGSEGLTTSGLPQQGKESKLEGVSAVKGESADVKASQNAARAEVWSIVEKLVDKITELKSSGKTEITITLKEPPMFQGAQIRIMEESSSKNQFNIAFENLSPQA
jgi:hypothetical protein